MQIKQVAKGKDVIRQGDAGDFLYIVKSGFFDILIGQGDDIKKVWEAGQGFAFGELALLYLLRAAFSQGGVLASQTS